MQFNNETIQDNGGTYLEPGEYDVFVFEYQFDQTKKGTQLLKYKFKTDDGGLHIEDFYLSEKAQWKLKRLSVACGFRENEIWEENQLIGKKIHIKVVKESYEKSDGSGQGYSNKISQFSPCTGNTGNDGTFQTSTDVSGQDPF